jgi:hypothetical protein
MLAEMARDSAECRQAAGGSVTETVSGWLAIEYVIAARARLAQRKGGPRLKILRDIVHDWAILQRGERSAARLKLDCETLDWLRSNSQSAKEKQFWEWVKRPDIHRKLYPRRKAGISKKTIRRIEREFNLK